MISYFQPSIVLVLHTDQYRRCQPRGRHASSSLWTGTLTIIITHDLVFSALDRVGPAYSPVEEMSAERKARILLLADKDFGHSWEFDYNEHAVLIHEEGGRTYLRGWCPSLGLGE